MTIGSSVLTTTDINGGTIDNTTIATSDITVGSGKTLDVSDGTLTLANDQISGDKVEGGTIAATTITTLTSTTSNISTLNVSSIATLNTLTVNNDANISQNLNISENLNVDKIYEKTSGSGVTIDSVLLKDNNITAHTISAQNYSVGGTNFISASRQGNFRDLEVKDNANNSTILLSGGTLGVSGGDISITGTLSTDTISEKTSGSGVTIDSVLLKDNIVTANTISAQNYNVGGINCISAI